MQEDRKVDEEKTRIFSDPLLIWFIVHGRVLPWRGPAVMPYEVVVSEFMLQQTQVTRVIEKYKEFLGLFPTIFDLARADASSVVLSWSGLGYNRRALLLHRFAQEVVSHFEGVVPSDSSVISTLPGVGPYMQGSILSFAFNLSEPAVDVNVRRIFLRFFSGRDVGLPLSKVEERELWSLVRECIPDGRSHDFHSALMDFGSTVCLRDRPLCMSCPLSLECKFAPLYKTDGKQLMVISKKRLEQGLAENGKHIPNRIFRGRIVEFARGNSGEIRFFDLGCAVKKDFALSEMEWLRGLCVKLASEGLIRFREIESMETDEGRIVEILI